MSSIKALFIITAANNPDTIEVLPKCLEDLFRMGIGRENIIVYDMPESSVKKPVMVYAKRN